MSTAPSSSRTLSPLTDRDAHTHEAMSRLALALTEQELFAFVNDDHAFAWASPRTHPQLARRLAEHAQRLFSSELARRFAAHAGQFPLAVFWGRVRDVMAEDTASLVLHTPAEPPTVDELSPSRCTR